MSEKDFHFQLKMYSFFSIHMKTCSVYFFLFQLNLNWIVQQFFSLSLFLSEMKRKKNAVCTSDKSSEFNHLVLLLLFSFYFFFCSYFHTENFFVCCRWALLYSILRSSSCHLIATAIFNHSIHSIEATTKKHFVLNFFIQLWRSVLLHKFTAFYLWIEN